MNNTTESQDRTRNTTLAATNNTYNCNNTTFSSQRPQRIDKEDILARMNKEAVFKDLIPSIKGTTKGQAMGLCPFHDDHNPSLSVNLETGLYQCFACGASGDIFKFLMDKEMIDFKTALEKVAEISGVAQTTKIKQVVVATFEYRNTDGNLIYIKERLEPGRNGKSKKFIFKHKKNGNWKLRRGSESVLYNLSEVIKSKKIIIVEGEGKAEFLKLWGIVATTLDSGANSPWKDHYLTVLEDKEEVVILPDNDNPGRDYASKIAKALQGKVKTLKVIALPGLQEAEDIIDWAKIAGNNKERLQELIKEGMPWKAEQDNNAEKIESKKNNGINCVVQLVRGDEINPEPISWLWEGWLAKGKLHILAGDPGTGKTTVTMKIAATVTTGGVAPDGTNINKGNVLIWSGEDDVKDTLLPRFIAAGGDCKKIHFVLGAKNDKGECISFDPSKHLPELQLKAKEIDDVALMIIDPLVNVVTTKDHSNASTRRDLQPLADFTNALKIATIGIHHLSKGSKGQTPTDRVTGSIAFSALARLIMIAIKTRDDESKRLIVRAKSNIGPDGNGFYYSFTQKELEGHSGVKASQLEWGAFVVGDVEKLLSEEDKKNKDAQYTLEEAASWLEELLKDNKGKMERKKIIDLAEKTEFSQRTIQRAREKIGVTFKCEGFGSDKKSIWSLPSCETINISLPDHSTS